MKTKKYSNRYGDEYKFTPTEDGHILWEGNFKWCRSSWPNVYDDAYRRYQEDGGELSESEFIEEIHRQEYDAEGNGKKKKVHICLVEQIQSSSIQM
jgi:hypothetical protein